MGFLSNLVSFVTAPLGLINNITGNNGSGSSGINGSATLGGNGFAQNFGIQPTSAGKTPAPVPAVVVPPAPVPPPAPPPPAPAPVVAIAPVVVPPPAPAPAVVPPPAPPPAPVPPVVAVVPAPAPPPAPVPVAPPPVAPPAAVLPPAEPIAPPAVAPPPAPVPPALAETPTQDIPTIVVTPDEVVTVPEELPTPDSSPPTPPELAGNSGTSDVPEGTDSGTTPSVDTLTVTEPDPVLTDTPTETVDPAFVVAENTLYITLPKETGGFNATPQPLDGGPELQLSTGDSSDPLITRTPDDDTYNPRRPDMVTTTDPVSGLGTQSFEGAPGSSTPSDAQVVGAERTFTQLGINGLRILGGVLVKSPRDIAIGIRNIGEALATGMNNLVAAADEAVSRLTNGAIGTVNQEGRQFAEIIQQSMQDTSDTPLPDGTYTSIDSKITIPVDDPATASDGFPDQVPGEFVPPPSVVISDTTMPDLGTELVIADVTTPTSDTASLDLGVIPPAETPPPEDAVQNPDTSTRDVVITDSSSGLTINLWLDITAGNSGKTTQTVAKTDDKLPPDDSGDTVQVTDAQQQLNELGLQTDPTISFLDQNAANTNVADSSLGDIVDTTSDTTLPADIAQEDTLGTMLLAAETPTIDDLAGSDSIGLATQPEQPTAPDSMFATDGSNVQDPLLFTDPTLTQQLAA